MNVCPVYTWICVFPPLRSAMPIKMLSSKIRSFLVLTMRSMTSSDAPTLSSAHWMSTKLVPGLSESCPGKPPMYTQNTVESGMRGAEVRREDLRRMVSQQSFCWWSFTSRGRAVPAAVLQGFGVGPMVAKVVYEETLPQCVTLRKPERKAVGSSFKYGVYQIFRFFQRFKYFQETSYRKASFYNLTVEKLEMAWNYSMFCAHTKTQFAAAYMKSLIKIYQLKKLW